MMEMSATNWGLNCERIGKGSRIQPCDSLQKDNPEPRGYHQMKTISDSKEANNRFTPGGIRRDRRIEPTDTQNNTRRPIEREFVKTISKRVEGNNKFISEGIIRRDSRIEPIDAQHDTLLPMESEFVKTVSKRVEANNSDRVLTHMRSRRNIRGELIDSLEETVSFRTEVKQPVFAKIFTFCSWIGLPFSTLLFSENAKKKMSYRWLKLWIMGAMAAKTVFFAILCVYNHLIWKSFTAQCAFLIHCGSGYILTLIFHVKRRQIMVSIRKVISLISFLNGESANKIGDPMKAYFPLSIVCIFVMSSIQINLFFFTGWQFFTNSIKPLILFPENTEYFIASCYLVFFSLIFTFNIAMQTLYTALYLIVAAYRYSGSLFTLYGNKLRKDIERGYFTAQTGNESISQFQQVVACANEIDNTFNFIAFIICVNLYAIFFASVNLAINSDQRYHTPDLQLFTLLCLKIGIDLLLYLCYGGDQFYEPVDDLKKEIVAMSISLMKRPSVDTSTLVIFNLLSKQIKEARPCVTVWGVYDVKSRLILHILGSLISYGALLSQMGAYVNN